MQLNIWQTVFQTEQGVLSLASVWSVTEDERIYMNKFDYYTFSEYFWKMLLLFKNVVKEATSHSLGANWEANYTLLIEDR